MPRPEPLSPKLESAVDMAIQDGVTGTGLVPSKYIEPIWGRITKEGPYTEHPEFYEWEQVYPDNRGVWQPMNDTLPGSYKSQNVSGTLFNPAVEINGGSIEVGSVVRLIPTRLITDSQGNTHRAWLFANPKTELRPFRLYADVIPTGGGELDTTARAEWLDSPGSFVDLYPEHRSGWPAGDQFISLGIGRGPGMAFRGTYGWAKWIAKGTLLGYDYEGEPVWRGEWQIVTLYADLIAQVLVYEKAIEPGDVGMAQLLWADKNAVVNAKWINSGYSIRLFNNKQVRLEVGMMFDAYFSRPHYIWTPLTVPYQPSHAKIGTAWTNTSHGSDANESVIANECDYAGRNVGKEITLTTLMKPSHDTAMFAGDVVQYDLLTDGTRIITSDIWDLPIGRVVLEGVDTENIRRGWFLCDGNNGTPDLSGMFIMCIDDHGLGDANEDEIGDGTVKSGGTAGFRDHGGVENDHDDHTQVEVFPFDEVLIGATPVVNLDAGRLPLDDFAGCECPEYQATMEHTKTDNRPRYYVMAAIRRME